MARPKAKAPARSYHISGQSIVRIDGRDFYLGKHDSPESIARYAVLIGIYQKHGLRLPDDFNVDDVNELAGLLLGQVSPAANPQPSKGPVLVRHVTALFREHVKKRYANDEGETFRFNQLCRELDEHEGDTPAEEFGPLALQRHRDRWIARGNARTYVNRLTRFTIRIFKYAESQELVASSAWKRLESVETLREGHTEARESEPVTAVAIEVVRATAKQLSPVLKAMIRVHIATGMRPSELCRMRPMDIDRTGEVWMYRPKKHKTAGRGKLKAVPLIGDARDAITDYLNRAPDAFCFSPKESVAWWQASKRALRKSKVQPSQTSRAKAEPRKQPGECFDANSYRQSIQRAAKSAGVEKWHPYQLRHLAATVVRDLLGIEAASALLGHARINMTQHYAPQTEAKAIEAAKVAPKL